MEAPNKKVIKKRPRNNEFTDAEPTKTNGVCVCGWNNPNIKGKCWNCQRDL